jgi:predicted MFS family arabinose efflux permease
MTSHSPILPNPSTHSFAAVAPFFLSSFAWNVALGMTFILIPLYASSLGMSGVQIGSLLSLPVVLHIGFSLAGGAFTDRLGGKNLSAFSCALTSIAAAVFMASDSFLMLLAGQILIVIARSMFWTANLSLATQLPGDPGKQMGRFTIATNSGQIAGSTLAGFIIAWSGFRFGFGAMVAAGLVALLLNQMYKNTATITQPGPKTTAIGKYRELLGIRAIRLSMFCAYISALPVALMVSFFPILLTQHGLDSQIAGTLLSIRGVGAIAAGFVVGKVVKNIRQIRIPLISSMSVGLSVLLTTSVSQPILIALFMFTLGAGSAVITNYAYLVIREISTKEVRGSATGLFNVGFGMSHLTTPFIIGLLRDVIGIENAFYIMGSFTLICGLSLIPVHQWAFAKVSVKEHQITCSEPNS